MSHVFDKADLVLLHRKIFKGDTSIGNQVSLFPLLTVQHLVYCNYTGYRHTISTQVAQAYNPIMYEDIPQISRLLWDLNKITKNLLPNYSITNNISYTT